MRFAVSSEYDTDFLTWTEQQGALLRRMGAGERVNNQVDWDNVAEEIEAVGRSEKREVRSRLIVLCQHLLKWEFQPEHRSPSWRSTIRTQRRDLVAVLEDSPSLRPFATQVLSEAYASGREDAAEESGMTALPEICPWSLEQIINQTFWPGVA